MFSELLAESLQKLWKPLLIVLGAIVSYLYVYFKGRAEARAKYDGKLKDIEIETQKTIIEEQEKNAQHNDKVDRAVDALPDEFDARP